MSVWLQDRWNSTDRTQIFYTSKCPCVFLVSCWDTVKHWCCEGDGFSSSCGKNKPQSDFRSDLWLWTFLLLLSWQWRRASKFSWNAGLLKNTPFCFHHQMSGTKSATIQKPEESYVLTVPTVYSDLTWGNSHTQGSVHGLCSDNDCSQHVTGSVRRSIEVRMRPWCQVHLL